MIPTVVSSGLLPLVEIGLYDHMMRRGVIHVGANDAAEVSWYLDRAMFPVLCFEPHPGAFKRALDMWAGHSQVDLVRLALSDRNGEIEMRIPADGDDEKTTARVPIPTEGHDWTTVPLAGKIRVPMLRFDDWMTTRPDLMDVPFGTLVVDVQGMEMEVLRGFGGWLEAFDVLCVELSEKPIYGGEPKAAEVVAWLLERGFKQATEIVPHGDVCFIR